MSFTQTVNQALGFNLPQEMKEREFLVMIWERSLSRISRYLESKIKVPELYLKLVRNPSKPKAKGWFLDVRRKMGSNFYFKQL